jgi:iron complex transport system substrate-binding protein
MPAIRAVSMLPAATEIVAALGLLDQLVAVSHECDFPQEVNRLPRVTHCEIHGQDLSSADIDLWVAGQLQTRGTLYTIDETKLRELAPDLILTQRLCDVCAPAYGSVAALADTLPSRPRVLNLEPRCLADILEDIRAVAQAMGRPENATELCRDLQSRIDAVTSRVRGLNRPSAFIMEWTDPIYNSGHWNPELIRLAGGAAVLSPEGQHSVRINWDDLRAADPELLIIACCGQSIARTELDFPLLRALPGWTSLNAVRVQGTFVFDGSAYFSRPGPRIVDTLEIMAKLLHPEAYSPEEVMAIPEYSVID